MYRPERYNAKARAGTLHKKGKVHKKKHATRNGPQVDNVPDANADVLERKTDEAKEAGRRAKMRQQLLEESTSKASSQKKKRLDKYIDKKLKKEERLELFEKLVKTQAQLSSTLHLQSSATLGTGRPTTSQARLERQEDKEARHAFDRVSKKRQRRTFSSVAGYHSDASESSHGTTVLGTGEDRMSVEPDESAVNEPTPGIPVDEPARAAERTVELPQQAVGSALRKNTDGTVAQPRILPKKEKGKRTILQKWKRSFSTKVEPEPTSDSPFDSSDSSEASSGEDGSSDEERVGASDGSESGSGLNSDSEEDEGGGMQEQPPPQSNPGSFKRWATAQLSAVKGYVVPTATDSPAGLPGLSLVDPNRPPPAKRRRISPPHLGDVRGPLGEDLSLPTTSLAQSLQASGSKASSSKQKFVSVTRPTDVEEARLLLPIVAEEQQIMEAILLNPVVVICGETGSGKTTQVPQFLYESGFGSPGSENPGMIGVTQPRRVAAMSMASRIAHELSLTSSRVSYQIRYDATVSPSTSIKFMTDGVLLRELATDFLLSKYSVVIIDEAHERSMNTDILIGVLSRVVRLRENMWEEGEKGATPLRLIIMSATLRVSDFTENSVLFPSPPPVLSVAARQHPVTIHFNRHTVSDYVTEAVRKASKIHARLPPGGILIFLTGQNEIAGVCQKLQEKYGARALEERKRRRAASQRQTSAQAFFSDVGTAKPSQVDIEAEDMDLGFAEITPIADDGECDVDTDDEEALDTDYDGENEQLGIDIEESEVPMHIVPLYSLLPSEKQMKVFEPPPLGMRLVVVATNVAETSLTIPGIRYVVDCGRAKERKYTTASGIQSFQVSWISKASASQRAGRAGRTGPGHCYRLYSSAVFENHFEPFAAPEILRVPIEGLVLQMKSIHIDTVVNFPFPTPPDRSALLRAETILTRLGALSPPKSAARQVAGGQITDLGKTMSLFPLSPRFSRMIVSGRQHGCLPYIIAIVSALSVGDPFVREEAIGNMSDSEGGDEEEEELAHLASEKIKAKERKKLRRRAFFQSQQFHASLGNSTSDLFCALSVIGAYEFAGGGMQFCSEHFVRQKAMDEIHKLRSQISNIVAVNFPGTDSGFVPNLPPPTAKQLKVLRQLLAAGFIDQIAVRKDLVTKDMATGNKHTTARGVAYRALGIPEDVYIHPSSIFANLPPADYVAFHETVRTNHVWLKGITVVNPAWIASLGKPFLCTFSKPFKNRVGELMVTPKFGPDGWELPAIRADKLQGL
ncbi:P-loop containing nucleoside triphosphate hydrolase protein [Vararia minispora EC-137]|uniref:P-loop containing nucleoside triphosphate hydrolase protein n=1 Tax=Vararia minispora EC-137 TaxID=1314806 RepID=A0ACB8QI67_9AGAM|nr:P-loop containing nucleoside triphosphate hydrolase protein [Vararia minispora EC-137]